MRGRRCRAAGCRKRLPAKWQATEIVVRVLLCRAHRADHALGCLQLKPNSPPSDGDAYAYARGIRDGRRALLCELMPVLRYLADDDNWVSPAGPLRAVWRLLPDDVRAALEVKP
jgi:hypothetical protein